MDQNKRVHLQLPLVMRLSAKSDCPYIAGQVEQRIAVDISNDPQCHDGLATAGFRRVENWVYRPACPHCNACLPWRVNVANFFPSQNMTNIIKRNKDLLRSIESPNPTDDHYQLFKSYVENRHDDGQMAQMNQYDFSNMINNSPIETVLINYHNTEYLLVASVLADIQADGLSAVYSFFDPALKSRSLGTYIILDLISIAREAMLEWLYLGYFVKSSRKMEYKARFRPAEVFKDGEWQLPKHLNSENFPHI